MVPETDEAMIRLVPVPTATDGVTPKKISSGVIRNPPPTPNMPDSRPTPPPSASRISALAESSAIGR